MSEPAIDFDTLIEILKDKLSIEFDETRGYYGDNSLIVKLLVDNEVISTASWNIPSREDNTRY